MSQLLSFGFVLKWFWSWSSFIRDQLKCLCKHYTHNCIPRAETDWDQAQEPLLKYLASDISWEYFSKGWVCLGGTAEGGKFGWQLSDSAWYLNWILPACVWREKRGRQWAACISFSFTLSKGFHLVVGEAPNPATFEWMLWQEPGLVEALDWCYTERPLQSWAVRSGLPKKGFLRHLFFSSNPLCYS